MYDPFYLLRTNFAWLDDEISTFIGPFLPY